MGDVEVVEAAIVVACAVGGADACRRGRFLRCRRSGERRGRGRAWLSWEVVVAGSGGGRERSDARERFGERVLPGPAGREVQRPSSGGARQPAGECEQPPPERA